ncbi:MAG TPA: hypothetical protein VFG14_12665 [Chthoniobacteraceae bacterium]|nr:hypothetical protein [Chthoniobacteraceae bacterium]
MNLLRPLLAVLVTAVVGHAAPPAKKPAGKPTTKSKSKPAVTVKDLAIREARALDTDYNGQINGTEVIKLQVAAKNPESRLYLFDDNSNGSLDSTEIAKIKFSPKRRPKP